MNGPNAKILALDTSGQHASAAIVADGMVLGEFSLNARHGRGTYAHSETLMPGVERLFELTAHSPADLTHVAYTCGPGSFTGLRIAASTALGLAFALNIPAVAVPTLDALAHNALGMGLGCDVCPILDARRQQVYAALYDSGLNRLWGYEALPLPDLLKKLRRKTLFLGDGVLAFPQILEGHELALAAPPAQNYVRASSAGMWALKNPQGAPGKLIYVREPQAVREQNNPCQKQVIVAQ